jgi:hypothetical protein
MIQAGLVDACQWEIETYAFDVLPSQVRPLIVTDSILKELQWFDALIAGVGKIESPL